MRVMAPAAASVEIRPNGQYRCAGMGSVFSSDRNESEANITLTADLHQICLILHTSTRIRSERLKLRGDWLLSAVFSGVYQGACTCGSTSVLNCHFLSSEHGGSSRNTLI